MIGPCPRCESPLAPEDLRCALCALPVPPAEQPDVAEEVAQILRCDGCGAAVRYSAEVQAPRCDFCGSVMTLEVPDDPIEQAECFLPFRVDAQGARRALSQWLGGLGFFRPRDLQTSAAIDALRPLWWVGWVFDAEVSLTWAADSDAGAGRSAWAPHAGQLQVSMRNVVVPASRGLTEHECRALIDAYDVAKATETPHDHPGATVEQFAVQRSAARRIVAESVARQAEADAVAQIPGGSYRNLHVAVLPRRLASRHFAFPAYVLAYRYDGEVYRAIVHGQDASRVIGRAPWSIARILGVVLAVIVVIAVIVALATSA